MSKPTKTELKELATFLSGLDNEDHEDDEAIEKIYNQLSTLSDRHQEILNDLLTPVGVEQFKKHIKQVCVGNLSFEQLEKLGIEDVLIDKTDPAGIVYKIVVSAWEGEGGM